MSDKPTSLDSQGGTNSGSRDLDFPQVKARGDMPMETVGGAMDPTIVQPPTDHDQRMAALLQNDPILKNAPQVGGFKVLDPAVLVEKLPEGGMASLYRGWHIDFKVEVAVKCLKRSDVGYSPESVERFRHEAESAARVNHGNLVRVYQIVNAHNINYIVMEFVDGETLDGRVRRKGPLPPEEAATITLLALEGLRAAHTDRIIHRDIKPPNIMISKRGHVKITDLGIAKSVNAEHSLQTKENALMGTPQYMAPEQFKSARSVTPAADVYAMGATLAYMVTGKHLIQGDDLPAIIHAVCVDGFPDVRKYRPDLPAELAELIKRTTAKDPAQRPTTTQFIQSLSEYLHKRGGPAELADAEAGRQFEPLAISSKLPTRSELTGIREVIAQGRDERIPSTVNATLPSPATPRTGSVGTPKVALYRGQAAAAGAAGTIEAELMTGQTAPPRKRGGAGVVLVMVLLLLLLGGGAVGAWQMGWLDGLLKKDGGEVVVNDGNGKKGNDPVTPDPAKPDPSKPDPSKPDPSKSDPSKPEPPVDPHKLTPPDKPPFPPDKPIVTPTSAPKLAIADVTVAEGDAGEQMLTFELKLSAAASQPVTVDVNTIEGTASAGRDYLSVIARTITFAPGETSKPVTVAVLGDTLHEDDETVTLKLSRITGGANLLRDQITGTIKNDDPPPTIAVNNATSPEGNVSTDNRKLTFTVALAQSSGKVTTVAYATEAGGAAVGEDFVARNGALTFQPGETSKQVEVEIVEDAKYEQDETVFLVLRDPAGGAIKVGGDRGTGTIINDDLSFNERLAAVQQHAGRAKWAEMLAGLQELSEADQTAGEKAAFVDAANKMLEFFRRAHSDFAARRKEFPSLEIQLQGLGNAGSSVAAILLAEIWIDYAEVKGFAAIQSLDPAGSFDAIEKWAKRAANDAAAPQSRACVYLADIYSQVRAKSDKLEAYRFLLKGHEAGDVEATARLGLRVVSDQALPADIGRALRVTSGNFKDQITRGVELLSRAADGNSPLAMYLYADMLTKGLASGGKATSLDLQRAQKYYVMAAKRGHVASQEWCGKNNVLWK